MASSPRDRFYDGLNSATKMWGESEAQDKDAKLKELLLGKQHQNTLDEQKNLTDEGIRKEAAVQAGSQKALDDTINRLQDPKYGKALRNHNISVTGSGGMSISSKEPSPFAGVRQQANDDTQARELSKRYEKLTSFNNALQEVDMGTNHDGKGGVLTNKDAQLQSAGKIMSAVPSAGVGLAEMFGVAPKGTTDERKSLDRLVLEYQKAMSGLRVSDSARAQEKSALGWIASGDSNLVSKGVRALARNARQVHQVVQAGYRPEIRDRVHGVMGDPMDQFANMYEDKPEPTPGMQQQQMPAPAPTQQPAAPRQQALGAPQAPNQDAELAELQALRAKHKPGMGQ